MSDDQAKESGAHVAAEVHSAVMASSCHTEDIKAENKACISRVSLISKENDDTSHAKVIRENFAQLVKELQPQLFLDNLEPCLKGRIDEDLGKKEKTRALLTLLMRSPRKQFDAFCMVIAGIHPKLFELLQERQPTKDELDTYLKPFCDRLRTSVILTGGKTDNDVDCKINLDTQYVSLKLVDISQNQDKHLSSLSNKFDFQQNDTMSFVNQDDILPDRYQIQISQYDSDDLDLVNVLTEHVTEKSILLTGRAGVGKSTLIQYVNRCWAKGNLATSHTVLFLLNLRRLAHITRRVTLQQLLGMYAEYVTDPLDSVQPVVEWLENNEERIIFFTDGIDEISDMETLLKETPTFLARMKATPLEWCINLIQRNILPKSTLVLVSRPFCGLSMLESDIHVDVLGLTPEKVMQYVEQNICPERQHIVKETLSRNPILLSICSITFYCAAICKIIEEDEEIDSDMLSTYTRITAFIISRLAARRSKNDADLLVLSAALLKSLPYMAGLAYKGLSVGKEEITSLVFDKTDFEEIGFLHERLLDARNTGLLITTQTADPLSETKDSIFQAEFLHLSIQELLTAAHTLTLDENRMESYLSKLNCSGQFNMNQLFLFGMALDKGNKYVACIKDAVVSEKEQSAKETHQRLMTLLLNKYESLCKKAKQSSTLQILQTAYESQSSDLASIAGAAVASNQRVALHRLQMTAVDMKALFFMMQHTVVKKVSFVKVMIDDASTLEIKRHIFSTKNLESLHLQENSISDEGMKHLSDAVEGTSSVKTLCLVSNPISAEGMKHLSNAIKATKCLTDLELQKCQITDKGLEYLCDAIETTESLCHLEISQNKMSDGCMNQLCQAIMSTQTLAHLKLNQNQISSEGIACLCRAIKETTALQHLDLYRNHLLSEDMRNLSDALKESKSLIYLGLVGNDIPEEGFNHLADAIKTTSSLHHLEVSLTPIPDKGMEALSVAIATSSSLRCLDLVANQLSDKGMHHLAQTVKVTTSLKQLKLSQNNLSSQSMKSLSEAIKWGTSLEALELRNDQFTTEDMVNLSDAVTSTSSLFHLKIACCQMTEEGMKAVSESVKTSNSLCHLELFHDQITANRMIHLSKAVKHTSNLKCLDLLDNMFSLEDMEHLSDAIKKSTALVQLKLSANYIPADGMDFLFEAIKGSKALNHLELSKIPLPVECVLSLSHAIKTPSSLQILKLSNNQITDEAMQHLSNAIKTGSKLNRLELRNNPITAEGIKHLSEAMRVATSLQHLVLEGIHITNEGMEHLSEAVSTTSCLKCLALVENHISGQGMEDFSVAIETTASLKQLLLSQSGLTDECVKSLCNGVRLSESLTHLQIAKSILSEESLRHLIYAIQESARLEFLQLAQINISDDNLRLLLKSLMCPQGLTHLQLQNNRISPTGRKILSEHENMLPNLKYQTLSLPSTSSTVVEECSPIF